MKIWLTAPPLNSSRHTVKLVIKLKKWTWTISWMCMSVKEQWHTTSRWKSNQKKECANSAVNKSPIATKQTNKWRWSSRLTVFIKSTLIVSETQRSKFCQRTCSSTVLTLNVRKQYRYTNSTITSPRSNNYKSPNHNYNKLSNLMQSTSSASAQTWCILKKAK